MDSTAANVSGVIALAISIVGTIIGIINHKKLKSSCCGRKLEISVDIENTTPPRPIGV